jgi:hypothetical protein
MIIISSCINAEGQPFAANNSFGVNKLNKYFSRSCNRHQFALAKFTKIPGK